MHLPPAGFVFGPRVVWADFVPSGAPDLIHAQAPSFEGEAYGLWFTGCPTCRTTGPSNRATRLTRGALFLRPPRLAPASAGGRSTGWTSTQRAPRNGSGPCAPCSSPSAPGSPRRSAQRGPRSSPGGSWSSPSSPDVRTIALYAPLGTEVDALEIARAASHLRAVYPRTVPGARRLAFARCSPRELVRGGLGTREPPLDAPEVDPADIQCVVLPGIGFSLEGHRLGRGRRLLRRHPARHARGAARGHRPSTCSSSPRSPASRTTRGSTPS